MGCCRYLGFVVWEQSRHYFARHDLALKHLTRVAIARFVLIDDDFTGNTVYFDLVVLYKDLQHTRPKTQLSRKTLHHIVKVGLIEHTVNKLGQQLSLTLAPVTAYGKIGLGLVLPILAVTVLQHEAMNCNALIFRE